MYRVHRRTNWDRRHRRFNLGHVVHFVLLATLILAGGCATRTVGMQAPLAHDYDGIQWRPLDTTISQAIIVAPGYTAVVENDPRTDPETLVQRIERLPDDVRSARLEEIRLAVRPGRNGSYEPMLAIQSAVTGSPDQSTIWSFEEIRFDGDWAIVDIPTHIWAGELIEISIVAGAGWEYGITVDRAPYGGYPAAAGAEAQPLRGSLGFQTVFSQSTDRSRMIEEDVWPAFRAAATDPLLITIYTFIVALGLWFIWMRRRSVTAALATYDTPGQGNREREEKN